MDVILVIIGAALLLVFLLPLFHSVHNLATVLGSAAGAVVLAAGIFWKHIGFEPRKYICFAVFVGLIVVGFAMYMLMRFGSRETKHGDILLVLGCRVKGFEPSIALQKRVDSAFFFLLNNPSAVAILSGGQGRDERISEAECMKNMLTERGVSPDRLYIEDKSTSTDENVRFSKELMETNGLGSCVVLCTSEYHQYRAKLICDRYGIKSKPLPSRTMPILLPTFLLRELMALVKFKIGNI